MKTFLLSAAALSLVLAGSSAMAQPDDQHKSSNAAEHHETHGKPAQPHGAMHAPAMEHRAPENGHNAPPSHAMEHRAPENEHNAPPPHAMEHDTHRDSAMHRGHGDVSHLRRTFTAPQRYHAGAYHAPHGYHYQHWAIGARLPGAYYARTYWLNDWTAFGLVAPPDGYVWVRVGPDALLIDEYSGEVIQVAYNVFY